jgi:hypothetical protein
MDYAGYVFGGYGAVLGALGVYAWLLVRRGRAAAREVPPERRRWSDAP